LFASQGVHAIEYILKKGGRIFLDLKFYDIPNTVARVSQAVSHMGVHMLNVHASGGIKMMQKVKKVVEETCKQEGMEMPLLLGVTVLTSFDERTFQSTYQTKKSVKEMVSYLASYVKKAGFHGVVASSEEIKLIKKKQGSDFIVVTPGIRPDWGTKGDQVRVMTPKEAFDNGADYIVVGRPITEAEDPAKAAKQILEEL